MSEHQVNGSNESGEEPRSFWTPDPAGAIGQKAASGGLIAIFGQLTRMMLVFLASAILARLLTPEDFGIVAMALAVTTFLGVFTDLGLSAATVQRRELDPEIVSGLFFVNILAGLLVALGTLAVAPLAAWVLDDRRLIWIISVLGLAVPFAAAGAQHSALLQRRMRWISLQVVSLGSLSAGAFAAIMSAAFTDLGYWSLVVQVVVVALVGLVLNWSLCSWRPALVKDWGKVREAVRFGLQLTGFNLLNYFHRQFDKLLVGWRWGATDLGYYSRAYSLFMMPLNALGFPLGAALIPAMSRLQSDPERWKRLYLAAVTGLTLVTAPLAGCLALLAEPVTLIVYGSQWRPAIPIFRILALSLLVQPVYSSAGWIYVSLGYTSRLARAGLVATLWYGTAFLVGLPFGVQGVAIAYTLAIVILSPVWLWWAVRDSALSFLDIGRAVCPPIAGALISLGVVMVLPGASSSIAQGYLIRVAVFLACFLVLVLVSWAVSPTWREHLRPTLAYLRRLIGAVPFFKHHRSNRTNRS